MKLADMKEKVREFFLREFSNEPTIIVRAPGRINLIGEHTDYNLGLVFPAAIDKSMYFAFRANQTKALNLVAHDLNDRISLQLENPNSDKLWVRYCLGIIDEYKKLGHTLPGFDCIFMSEIPIGAGLSSSAALECGFAKGIDTLIDSGLNAWDIVRMSNRSENNYLGIQSGILDQFSSMFGQEEKAMLMDCSKDTFEYYPVELAPYSLVLINTNVKHTHLSSGYNDRPAECKEVVKIAKREGIEIDHLSQLNLNQLDALKKQLTDTLYNRAQFIIEENGRVHKFKDALLAKNFTTLGDVLYASHYGLQNLYEVSCTELDLLVELSRQQSAIIGSRIMGGGFGGCTLNLILDEEKERVVKEISLRYHKQTGIEPSVYHVSIGNGVEVIYRGSQN